MKKIGDRAMDDLYDRTQKIPRLKIEGSSCKEPLDQPANKTGGINENNKSPSRKRSISDDDNPQTKPESGTCNVCNTPCTSCLHRMRVETDTSSAVGTCSEHFHCEDAETKSKLRNPNKMKPFDIRIVKLEGQGESISCVTKYSKEKDVQTGDIHRESSSVNSTEESQEKGRVNLIDSRESDSNFRVPQKNPAHNEKMFCESENCDKRDFADKDQKVAEVKNQENDNGLIDVNVCDICGDTGREYQLATCSRCIDGAEHTYCMRVRLEKLPEGDWLCEECQLKDKVEKRKQRHAATSPLSPPLSEKENKSDLVNSKNPFSRHKKLRISTNDAVYASAPPPSPYKPFKEEINPGRSSYLSRENSLKKEIGSSKEVISPRKTSNLCRENSMKMEICSPKGSSGVQFMKKSSKEVISPPRISNLCRENSMKMEICSPKGSSGVQFMKKSSKEMISPRKTSNLCRENSMKMEICSPKGSSGGQLTKKPQLLSRSYSLNRVSSLKDVEKGQAAILPPKGTMTKHLSFKNLSMKPKVKSVTASNASNPTKQRTLSSSLLKSTDESRPFRRLIKSASFKEPSPSRANLDPVKLTKPLSPTVQISTQMRADKEKISLGKKDSKGENHTDVLAQQHSAIVRKFEYKAQGSLLKKPKHGTSCTQVGPAVGDNKMTKTVLAKQHQANKKPRSILASKDSDKNFNRLKTAVKTVLPEAIDGENNGISAKPKVRISKAEVSHTSKNQKAISANVEEHSRSTLSEKSRVEKVSKDGLSLNGSSKKEELIDFDVIYPNIGVQKMEVPDMLSQPSSLDKGKTDDINVNTIETRVEKTKAPKDTLSHDRSLEKCMNSSGISDYVKNVEVEPDVPVVQDSSLLATSSETVIPVQDFVWQGNFEVLRAKTQAYESFDGIQAHFSTHVSHKVFEVVAKFSDKLQLEEVPWGTAWPLQSQEIEPSEEHVALFFFARDLESYEVSYSRLLQSLIGNNLALRGYISGSELLIFPSDKLPQQSQRWNSLFYLWGIFCARKQVPPENILNSCKPIGGPSGNLLTKINEDMKSSKELCIGNNLLKLKVEVGAASLDAGLESYKKQVEQNASTCLDPKASYADCETLNASQTACSTQICVVKAEDAAVNMAFLPVLERKMAEKISNVDNKTLLLGEQTDAELKPGNKQAHLSDETSPEFSLKRKRGQYGSKIETGHESSILLKKIASPKIHPLSIDLEKPADSCDVYSTEDVVGTSLRNVEQSKAGNGVSNAISLEDEDVAENKMPDLNLALGDKNPSQKDVRPLHLFPSVRSVEVERELSLSLALTIEPPGSERGLKSPIVKMQQFLPEKPVEKAPVRLFGGYISP